MNIHDQEITFGVVISSYNRPEYLRTAIESVATQDLPATEIVVVDDCSDFSIEELLADYSYLPLKIITKEHRMGASHSRNLGADNVSSDYVAFLDDDDAFLPNRLSQAKEGFIKAPSCDAFLSSYIFMDGRRRIRVPKSGRVDQEKLKQGNGYCGTSGFVVKTSVVQEMRFDEEIPSGEDWELFARLSQRGNFFFNDEPAFLYRKGIHASKTNQKKYLAITQMEERFVAADKLRNWLGEEKYFARLANQILVDLSSKTQVWQWVRYSLRRTGFVVTVKVLCAITLNKIVRTVRSYGA